MSKKIKDQEVLLVKDQKDDSLRAVVGADGKSGLKLHSFKAVSYTHLTLPTSDLV